MDNLVVGAGLVGSLTAHVLSEHGASGILIERSADPGGVNGSFSDPHGNWFDYGRHIINADRSSFTTEVVTELLDGRVRRFNLRRGIVVSGHLIPYAADLEEWPKPLQQRIRLDATARVSLGSARADFARAYGQWFADLAFDSMQAAYPILQWYRSQGVPEEHLMRWIFPWFFPRTEIEASPAVTDEVGVYSRESREYHYRQRHACPPREEALYPTDGRFASLVDAMLEIAGERFDFEFGVEDIDIDIDADTLEVRSVTAGGVRYTADRVFWCAPLPVLCRYVGWQLPKGEPQWELLGSFTFRDPVSIDYHEILFADPAHRIRRVNSPGEIAGQRHPTTLQVEYTTVGDEAQESGGIWRARWLDSLRDLGLVTPDNPVEWFDFRRLSRGVVSNEDLGEFLAGCERRIAESSGNLVAPHLAVASDNNCRLIPKVARRVQAVIA